MKIIDVAFVCYAVKSIKASRAWYEGALKLKVTQQWVDEAADTGFLEFDVGPTTIALGAGADSFKPGVGTNVTAALEVENFDEAVKHLRAFGAKFVMEPHETPVCHMVMIKDPDDNPIMLHKRK